MPWTWEQTALAVANHDLNGVIIRDRNGEIDVAITIEITGHKAMRPRPDDYGRSGDQSSQHSHTATTKVGSD